MWLRESASPGRIALRQRLGRWLNVIWVASALACNSGPESEYQECLREAIRAKTATGIAICEKSFKPPARHPSRSNPEAEYHECLREAIRGGEESAKLGIAFCDEATGYDRWLSQEAADHARLENAEREKRNKAATGNWCAIRVDALKKAGVPSEEIFRWIVDHCDEENCAREAEFLRGKGFSFDEIVSWVEEDGCAS
jgi:hypothetical protein